MREQKVNKLDQVLRIAIYIDNIERYRFFLRTGNAIEALGHKVRYLTPRLSVYGLLLAKGKNVHCLKHTMGVDDINIKELLKSTHVLARYHTIDQAKKIYGSTLQNITNLFYKHSVDLIFLWNGSSAASMALKAFARQNRIGCRFFEISNLGAKIFVDSQGVNAQSYLYRHPDILDTPEEVGDDEWMNWKSAYEKDKSVPRQALLKNKISLTLAIDAFGFLFGCIREDYRNPLKVIWNKLKTKQSECIGKLVDLQQESLCFLPLQVSNDTQLLINSDYSNEELIEIAHKFCKENAYALIVKIHPAEQNRDFVSRVYAKQKKYHFTLVCNETKELIQKSELLIVNNSTVGLEAMILDKSVKVYGKAVYSHFDSRRLRAYILRYLVNIDYFDDACIVSESEIQKILAING